LCDTLKGKVRMLNYRTVRYPGHRDIMKALIHDLQLGSRPEVLKDILEHAIPGTMQDVVLVFVTVSGYRQGRLLQESYASKIYGAEVGGKLCSAIQITTASGICAVLDLLAAGKIPASGFVRQEDIPLDLFLANRFGAAYAQSSMPGAKAA
jgi:saccharopine dehydrogenase-like NADP-dependent oxidoreductase